MDADEEEKALRTVALQNAHSIFVTRQRAEQELLQTKEALQLRTIELGKALALAESSLEERDRAQAEANAARLAAQAASEAKTRFLNMISHELRTPLGAIGGYADLIDAGIHGSLTDGQRDFISRIRHNQKHMLGLVNELLDLAKIESGRIDLRMSPVSVQAVIDSVHPMIEPQLVSRQLRLEIASVDPALLLHGDRDRVEQILLNLLSNAAKFSDAGSSIGIATSAMPDRISVHVRDSGVGIPYDKLDAIFEPFVQAIPSPDGTPRGTGLGLTISRQLARAMGGNLTVESVVEHGSTFTLSLPRA